MIRSGKDSHIEIRGVERAQERSGLLTLVRVRPDLDFADAEDLVQEVAARRLEDEVSDERSDPLVLWTERRRASEPDLLEGGSGCTHLSWFR